MDPTNNFNQNPNQVPNVDANMPVTPSPMVKNDTMGSNSSEMGGAVNATDSSSVAADVNVSSTTTNANGGVNDPLVGAQSPVLQSNQSYANPTATNPVNPVYHPNQNNEKLAATDPIMKPEPAPAPDPVEEELKAPMKAAEPVPGSIGSAVSVPADGNAIMEQQAMPMGSSFVPNSNNVSFNDPAMNNMPASDANAKSDKKKSSKALLITLIIILIVAAAGLGVMLFVQMNGGSLFGGNSNGGGSISNNTGGNTNDNGSSTPNNGGGTNNGNNTPSGGGTGGDVPVEEPGMFSCERSLISSELAAYNAESGQIEVMAMFMNTGVLHKISVSKSVKTSTATEPEIVESESYLLEDLTAGGENKLEIDTSNIATMKASQMITEFEALDYTCEVL